MKRYRTWGMLALLCVSMTALADSNQNHTCQGGHNCNTGSGGGSSTNTVTNTNQNSNSNFAGAESSVSNNTSNYATGGTSISGAAGGNSTSVSTSAGGQGGNATGGTSSVGNTTSSSSSQGGSVNASGNTVGNGGGAAVVVEGNKVAAAQAGTAATVISGSDQCRVGNSVGGQAMSFGFVIGTNTADEVCERIKLSRELNLMGLKSAALALLAQDVRVRQALESVANGELFAK